MHITPLIWGITVVVLLAVLLVDIMVLGRRPHEPSMKESGIAIGCYTALAIAFGVSVWGMHGSKYAGEFFAGWLTEYSLSVDNLFIFLLIMAAMKVPRALQSYALMVGIVLALIFRGIFIALGAAIIARFSPVFFIFGAFLLYTAVSLVRGYFNEDEEDATDSWVMRQAKKAIPSVAEFHGTKQFIIQNGKKLATPMFFVIVALGSTDLMFALDSIPAIFGLTQEPYLVFAANVFALMGLRQLYFLLGNMLKKLVYLSLGLSFILAFIGIKLLLHAAHEQHWVQIEIPTSLSLVVIILTLLVTTVASLVSSRRRTDLAEAQTNLISDADDIADLGMQKRL
ncbi:MAG: TerC family protein [Propionibacteriaceae bacterium]